MGVFCVGAAKVKKSSPPQQPGVRDPAPPAFREELLLLVSSYSTRSQGILFLKLFGMKNYLTDHLYLFLRVNS